MAQSFQLDANFDFESCGAGKASNRKTKKVRIAVTGATGNIGSYFAAHAPKEFDLTLLVHKLDNRSKKLEKYGRVAAINLMDIQALTRCFSGHDTVLHLAADASPEAQWDSLLPNNIVGVYNVFVAAKAAGCRQVVYASSIHAVSGYPADVQVKPSDPVNPGDMYGVSKCFGEALARYMATHEQMHCIAIRIGAFQPTEVSRNPESIGMLDAWVSRRDMQQILERCIRADHIRFAIIHAVSDNRFKRLDISETRDLLRYEPKDDFTQINEQVRKLKLAKTVKRHSAADANVQSGIRSELARSKRSKGREN